MRAASQSALAFGFTAMVVGCAPTAPGPNAPATAAHGDPSAMGGAPGASDPQHSRAASAPPQTPPSAALPASHAPAAGSSSAPVECRHGERRYGTTCCYTERGDGEGVGRTTCYGPNLGTPCSRKSDCDLFCSCDDPTRRPPQQGSSPRGPADGTRGVTGRCASDTARGAWVCRIDDDGRVTHLILD